MSFFCFSCNHQLTNYHQLINYINQTFLTTFCNFCPLTLVSQHIQKIVLLVTNSTPSSTLLLLSTLHCIFVYDSLMISIRKLCTNLKLVRSRRSVPERRKSGGGVAFINYARTQCSAADYKTGFAENQSSVRLVNCSCCGVCVLCLFLGFVHIFFF